MPTEFQVAEPECNGGYGDDRDPYGGKIRRVYVGQGSSCSSTKTVSKGNTSDDGFEFEEYFQRVAKSHHFKVVDIKSVGDLGQVPDDGSNQLYCSWDRFIYKDGFCCSVELKNLQGCPDRNSGEFVLEDGSFNEGDRLLWGEDQVLRLWYSRADVFILKAKAGIGRKIDINSKLVVFFCFPRDIFRRYFIDKKINGTLAYANIRENLIDGNDPGRYQRSKNNTEKVCLFSLDLNDLARLNKCVCDRNWFSSIPEVLEFLQAQQKALGLYNKPEVVSGKKIYTIDGELVGDLPSVDYHEIFGEFCHATNILV